jgi:hypothetical protein
MPVKVGLYLKCRFNLLTVYKIKFKIKSFSKKFAFCYIYGAGKIGDLVGGYLESKGVLYQGFLVSSISGHSAKLRDHEIKEFDLKTAQNQQFGMILALGEKFSQEVRPKLLEQGLQRQILYFTPKEIKNMFSEMAYRKALQKGIEDGKVYANFQK